MLLNPTDVAVDRDGFVYVVDAGPNRVQKFDAQGNFILGFPAASLSAPRGLVSEGRTLLVTDPGASLIHRFTSSGSLLGSFDGNDGQGATLGAPAGLCIDSLGDIYVADEASRRVVRLSPSGKYAGTLLDAATAPNPAFRPTDVAWDSANELLLVADAGGNAVHLVDRAGALQRTIDGATLGLGGPTAVLSGADDRGNSVYVADGPTGRMLRISLPSPSPAAVWDEMKSRLSAGDIQGALSLFRPLSRSRYDKLFRAMAADLPAIVAAMQPITPVYERGPSAQYQLIKTELRQGQPVDVAYFVKFRRNEDGQWEIESF